MTAPTTDAPAVDIPEGAAPIRLPVMVVEGLWTADGRFIEPGALGTGIMPITLFSQTKSSHGSLDGDTSTVIVGSITDVVRKPGPEVIQLTTGQPFPEGTFVWEGTGWMYKDVPAPPDKSAYQLVHDKALRGNSVDLSQVDAEFEYDDDQDLASDPSPRRITITRGLLGASTLVGQPAFPDAYIELEGQAMDLAPEPRDEEFHERNAHGDLTVIRRVLAASAVPMWRSADVGDICAPCVAVEGPRDEAVLAAVGTLPDGEFTAADEALIFGNDIDPEEITPVHTGGMVALVPANPNMLVVPGGDPAQELHLTLCYLGDDVSTWRPEDRAAVMRIALEATSFDAMRARMVAEAVESGADPEVVDQPGGYTPMPGQDGPLEVAIFSHAVFNPNGDNGKDPATVYLMDGTADRPGIDLLAETINYQIRDAIGTAQYPEQHRPFIPHVTAGYGIPVDQLTYTGPVQFDRLRVALGDDVTDFPLGGGNVLTAGAGNVMVAAGTPLPPSDWFADPGLTEPTAPVVGEMTDAGAPVYGHLACWGTCHIGFNGKCITPPRSASAYAYFMVHTTQVADPDGNAYGMPVGYGTIATGHASIQHDALAAAEHYDNTGTVAFEYTVGEDEHGIWFAGRLLPGLDAATEHKARGTVFSGDWRTIRGNLELVASLGVNVPGFPVPRVRVASGAPFALVAAGVPALTFSESSLVFTDGGQPVLTMAGDVAELLEFVREQRAAGAVARALAEVTHLTSGALTEVELGAVRARAALTLALDAGHPWFDDLDSEDFGMRIPPYIKRIAKHLQAGGMEKGHAIAAAKNAAQKMCDTGDLNFPGSQEVNPGSRAEACEAIAQWDAQRVK